MVDREKLAAIYRQNLEEDIIQYLAELQNLSIRDAMDIYYRSRLSEQISRGDCGIENLDYKYLVEDLVENESELFGE